MDVKSKKFNIWRAVRLGNGCCQLVSLKVKRCLPSWG